jgi:hypothetical protein
MWECLTKTTTNELHGGKFLQADTLWSRNVVPFMESEGSLPCWQDPASGRYPEPD